jgi:DNA-binding NarL/FixJ family response regulator
MTKLGRNDDIEVRSPQIRVVIADDHPVARQGLSAILGSLDDVKVVAEAGRWRGGLSSAARNI